jgi:hypothetical protein
VALVPGQATPAAAQVPARATPEELWCAPPEPTDCGALDPPTQAQAPTAENYKPPEHPDPVPEPAAPRLRPPAAQTPRPDQAGAAQRRTTRHSVHTRPPRWPPCGLPGRGGPGGGRAEPWDHPLQGKPTMARTEAAPELGRGANGGVAPPKAR